MEWTGLNELREKFLSFYESKGHLRLNSFPLVPKDDKSLLLINSGMAPMKKYFTGEITPPKSRVTTCQKCIRTPDIERVGITARHGTYFEMLGNFSFGDYFKNEAIAWAWEFFTEVLKMPKEKLYISIYEKDDEAFEIWTKKVGVAPDHMVRLGKEDNFWEHGTGPCGPCSEIYFDRGEEKGCGSPDCAVGCECDRFVEVWNLVFTQFDSDGKGGYTPLEHPNIDTGMGLERLACVMQGVDNLFLVDTVQNIMKHISKITGVEYGSGEKEDVSLRVITDHIRSTTFMISDGVMPSNEGRGYVLRRLLRRAARHGRLLGVYEPFLYQVCETVIAENKDFYPELEEKKELITKLIKIEEENFGKTIDQGLSILNDLMDKTAVSEISGEEAFKLNDTFGFPIDLTKEILAEKGMTVNEERFKELLQEQKKRARESRKNAGEDAWLSDSVDLSDIDKTVFTGYNEISTNTKVLAIIKDGQRVESVAQGDDCVLVLQCTPFYAESGGQVGDSGNGILPNGTVEVFFTSKTPAGVYLHKATVNEGIVTVGDSISALVDGDRRKDIMRNHTGAHLLQAALRQVLGSHVEQAGQLVNEKHIRFDFTHFSPMTAKELLEVEEIVNQRIFDSLDVDSREMPIEEAKKLGAMALFGEKYGNVVRVVKAGDFSLEFCGGTHIDNTSKLGLFKIISESSVAAGVRRIEAVTGKGVLNTLNNCFEAIETSAMELKLNNPKELVNACRQLTAELKNKDKQLEALNNKIADAQANSLFGKTQIVKGCRILSAVFTETSADALKIMCDRVISNAPKAVVVVGGVKDGKATLACACGEQARKRGAHAGKIVKAVAQIAGGNGGGRPDIAMAGAKDIHKLDDAIMAVKDIVLDMVSDEE